MLMARSHRASNAAAGPLVARQSLDSAARTAVRSNPVTPFRHAHTMITDMSTTTVVAEQADADQWAATRDSVAQHFLGVSAAEFVARFQAGAFDLDTPGLMAVLALFPELD